MAAKRKVAAVLAFPGPEIAAHWRKAEWETLDMLIELSAERYGEQSQHSLRINRPAPPALTMEQIRAEEDADKELRPYRNSEVIPKERWVTAESLRAARQAAEREWEHFSGVPIYSTHVRRELIAAIGEAADMDVIRTQLVEGETLYHVDDFLAWTVMTGRPLPHHVRERAARAAEAKQMASKTEANGHGLNPRPDNRLSDDAGSKGHPNGKQTAGGTEGWYTNMAAASRMESRYREVCSDLRELRPKTFRSYITRACKGGKLESIGEGRSRLIEPRSLDAYISDWINHVLSKRDEKERRN